MDIFHVFSTDRYESTEKYIESFTTLLEDAPVHKYITEQGMLKYAFKTAEDLADILQKSFRK